MSDKIPLAVLLEITAFYHFEARLLDDRDSPPMIARQVCMQGA